MQIYTFTGKCSTFGGPHDTGVAASEDLALYDHGSMEYAPMGMFLTQQPPNTTGTARRLNVAFPYVAMRWAYNQSQVNQDAIVGHQNVGKRLPVAIPQSALRKLGIKVSNPKTGAYVICKPADFGPNGTSTDGRIIDCSPVILDKLGLQTDDVVDVSFTV
jgi:hypothetical protein